ncbi:hypothetical protein CLV51_10946 [Chitinophaga niastensis]|uniref:Substrate import-associated zinc metallohydrolase lipoprotein n=1 Tax=Chitinophaga niastensis TaxID=536980 RepID=A0A2P8HA03_CHINA|nr:hypothetical protein [Chitinophaga niastensis]PSL43052.1 hypothetical protein CLV51_10946 [Chitinophaga niastensis]
MINLLKIASFMLIAGALSCTKTHDTSSGNVIKDSVENLTPKVMAVPVSVVAYYKLSPFYQKFLDLNDLPILSSAAVPDAALQQAYNIIKIMCSRRPEAFKELKKNKIRIGVMGVKEKTTTMPEHSDLTPKDYWDARARGLGATLERPLSSCAEENLLGYPGDSYKGEDITVHEFSHTFHQMAMNYIDTSFDRRLKATYNTAMANGLWANTYSATNYLEYFAEGVQIFFNVGQSTKGDGIHNGIYNRIQLYSYDRALHDFIADAFGGNDMPYMTISKYYKQ